MKHLFRLLLIALACFSAAGIYFWTAKGLRYYSVQTGSMAPTLRVGDLAIDEKTRPDNIKIGDVITYASLADPRTVITHRVINKDKNKEILMTQGDNLATADPPVSFNAVQGKTVKVLPLGGYILDSLRNPLGLIVIIYIPVLALATAEIRKLAKRYHQPYKHAKHS